MATIYIDIGAPYGTIAVNTEAVCAAIPDPVSPESSSDLLIDSAGGRSITALIPITEAGKVLGDDFAEFTAADEARSVCFVSRTAWISVAPHPQVAKVSQIGFAHRRVLGVAGEVKDAMARLERTAAAKKAKRTRAR